ncbi:MAG TPA: hypothetical protein VLA51_02175 [Paracoccaceae bacterium]|nr:hypothetical protein [Paracoccaceae bacterium]
MRQFVFALALLLPAPLLAQDDDATGPSLMERGAQLFLEGLMNEMGPAIEGMQDFVEQMGPALRDLMREVKDWSLYEAPEVLPNGDIIIRRKPETPKPLDEPEPLPDGQIEL